MVADQIHLFLLVPSLCTWIQNIKDSLGGYLKTICYIPLARNQDMARTHCVSGQMKLLTFDTDVVKTAVLDFSNTKFGSGWILWVEGRNTTGCVSIKKYTKFVEQLYPCTTSYYFYCEYQMIQKSFVARKMPEKLT